jgi:hypothetical protein
MYPVKHIGEEVVVLGLLMLLGWAVTVGMLIEYERTTERRIQTIEQQLCSLSATGATHGPPCPETK